MLFNLHDPRTKVKARDDFRLTCIGGLYISQPPREGPRSSLIQLYGNLEVSPLRVDDIQPPPSRNRSSHAVSKFPNLAPSVPSLITKHSQLTLNDRDLYSRNDELAPCTVCYCRSLTDFHVHCVRSGASLVEVIES